MKALHKTAISAAAVALLSGVVTTAAFAADAPAAEVSPITANVTVVNDYRYRGMTQSNFKPAIQGGFDYAHESGFYIGNWNSSISWISDSYNGKTASAPIEMDFYAGYKKEFIGEGFASDFGVLQYYYPTENLVKTSTLVNPNTTEVYAAQNFTFGPITGFAKISYAVTTLFGNANSTGSYYPDLTLNYDTGMYGVSLNGHIGYQYVAGKNGTSRTITNDSLLSYTDWKLGLTKDFGGGLSGSLAYVGTNGKTSGGAYQWITPQNKNMGQAGYLVSLTKAF